jgi:hypothetical protein
MGFFYFQDPAGIFELIEVVGNGTYGQVYKVRSSTSCFIIFCGLKSSQSRDRNSFISLLRNMILLKDKISNKSCLDITSKERLATTSLNGNCFIKILAGCDILERL